MAKHTGKIIPNGVALEKHENLTVVFLTEQGFDVELIPPSQIEGIHTPDIKMAGLKWEMKSPTGHSPHTIEGILRRALHQSPNIIIDSRRTKLPAIQVLREVSKQFQLMPIHHLKFISKQGELIDFDK